MSHRGSGQGAEAASAVFEYELFIVMAGDTETRGAYISKKGPGGEHPAKICSVGSIL
jgi:hypothetical protein